MPPHILCSLLLTSWPRTQAFWGDCWMRTTACCVKSRSTTPRSQKWPGSRKVACRAGTSWGWVCKIYNLFWMGCCESPQWLFRPSQQLILYWKQYCLFPTLRLMIQAILSLLANRLLIIKCFKMYSFSHYCYSTWCHCLMNLRIINVNNKSNTGMRPPHCPFTPLVGWPWFSSFPEEGPGSAKGSRLSLLPMRQIPYSPPALSR